MPYLLLVTTINWDSMVEGNVYLACQIYHTIPFIKSAECNTNDVYHRDSFINFINILTCLLLYFLNRATYDLSKRNPSKVQPHDRGKSLAFATTVTTGTWLPCEKSRKVYDVITIQMYITRNYNK